DVVELNILTRRHVGNSVGILFGQVRQALKLPGVETSAGNLDALHAWRVPQRVRPLGQPPGRILERLDSLAVVPLAIVIALPVNSPSQASFGKKSLIELALLSQVNFHFEVINFL